MKQAVNDSTHFETWYNEVGAEKQVKRIRLGKHTTRQSGCAKRVKVKQHRFEQRKYKRVWGQASW
jgi:hypothetical protein